MRRLWRLLTSVRTTLVLLALMALLLLLNVILPQAAVVGDEAFARIAVRSRWHHLMLVELGLGRMATSPIFLTALGLFFLNLAAVLAARTGATWRRTRPKARAEAALRAWAATGEGLCAPRPEGFGPGSVIETLRGFGYQARKVGEATVWGVKHRTAPLGFLLFHLSFFLLCAGGVMLWATRFVAAVTLTEGQELSGELGEYKTLLRVPPLVSPPRLSFSLESVETRFEDGEPTYLGAILRFPGGGEQKAWVNHPARWGSATVLVQRAGLAPVLWLQDERGFTLDRVAVAATTRGDEPTPVPLAGGRIDVSIDPLAPEAPFPGRSELAQTAITLRASRGEEVLFAGTLRPGEAASLGREGRLVLEELRYWAGVLVVAERGGGLLIAGFVLAVAGLVWRLVAYRREVAVVWDGEGFTLLGRSEYFASRFEEELAQILVALQAGSKT